MVGDFFLLINFKLMFLFNFDLIKFKYSFFSPRTVTKVNFLQKEDMCLEIAAAPPKYFSTLRFLDIRIGSFPDFPKASQKTYSSIMVSPITRTLILFNFSS